MKRLPLASAVVAAIVAAGCGSGPQSPAVPTTASSGDVSTASPAPAAVPAACLIGFEGLRVNGARFERQTACGLTVTASRASWQASTTYGSPAPFVQFVAPAGTTMTGDVVVHSDGGTFAFTSVEIYSSTTKIPFEIAGTNDGLAAFTLSAVQGNTFGNFATIVNPYPAARIDTLRLSLTNPAAPCCANPVGLDNIVIVR